jgi:hypothetical protein
MCIAAYIYIKNNESNVHCLIKLFVRGTEIGPARPVNLDVRIQFFMN